MRAASDALVGFLFHKYPFFSADLFTITPRQGSPVYLTSFDIDLAANGHTFSAFGPRIKRTRWSVKNTVEVPQMEIQLDSTGSDLALGNIKRLIYQGWLDGGSIQLERAFMPDVGNVALGTVLLFSGNVSSIDVAATSVKLTVKGANVLLQQYMPRNIYAANCIHSLYDAGCGLNKADFTFSHTVGASPGRMFVPWDSAPANPEYFNFGGVEITSGDGAGQVRTVLSADATGLNLAYPLDTVPAPGDAFSAYYGCSKARGANGEAAPNCTTPFANTANFRGFPFTPQAETAF